MSKVTGFESNKKSVHNWSMTNKIYVTERFEAIT